MGSEATFDALVGGQQSNLIARLVCRAEHRGGILAWSQRMPSGKKFLPLEQKYSGSDRRTNRAPPRLTSQEVSLP